MKIPISKNWFGDAEFAAIQQPLQDGWVVQGKQVRTFESAFAKYTQAAHALSCSSGTAALHIAVSALGLKPGDEVLVPGFTWIATANVVELIGAKPVFCDVDLDTFNASAETFASAITPRTKGMIPVHLFGLCAEMGEILGIAKKHGLWVVEDAACALGSWYKNSHAGTMGNLGCFSFHPRKSITTGEGGMLTLSDPDLLRICDGLRNHGAVPAPDAFTGNTGHDPLLPAYSIPGFNYRLTDIQGALGVAQLNRLEFLLSERKRCADYYAKHLANIEWLRLPRVPTGFVHAWQSYVGLYAPKEPSLSTVGEMHVGRNRLMAHLDANGIATRQGTHAPPHLDFYASKYSIQHQHFPNSWLADRLSIALPVFPGMTEDELQHVVTCIKSFDPGSTI
jgi:perosamine synthetase